MRLIKATQISKTQYENYLASWGGEDMVPSAARRRSRNFEEQLQQWRREETDAIRQEGFVPAELYFLVNNDDDKPNSNGDHNLLLGAIHLRLELNEFLLNQGGHIGYGVRPDQRRKGHTHQMMTLLKPILTEKGIQKVLLACDQDNVGSNKTIQRHGGKLENQIMSEEGKLINRYWIEIL